MPNPWRRIRRSADEAEDAGMKPETEAFVNAGLFESWPALAISLAAIVLFVVLIPLLGVALELIVLVAVFSSGLAGRVLLGHPWAIEARNLDEPERSAAYAVKGFRRAGHAVRELSAAIAASGPPERLSGGERTILPRPSREAAA